MRLEPIDRRRDDMGFQDRTPAQIKRFAKLKTQVTAPATDMDIPGTCDVWLRNFDSTLPFPKLVTTDEFITVANYDTSLSGGEAAASKDDPGTFCIIELIEGVWVVNNWIGC